jgi:hypothetical protein
LTYTEFIDEIRRLATQGESIVGPQFNHASRTFRNWRHDVQNTVANGKGIFDLPGSFSSSVRMYRANWSYATADDHREAYTRDIGDSIAELRFLIRHFDKFGAPKPVPEKQGVKVPLSLPEKMTARWLFDNVPVHIWLAGAVILVGASSLGFTLAQSEASRKFVAFIAGLFGH